MAPTADWRCGGRRPSRWFPALPCRRAARPGRRCSAASIPSSPLAAVAAQRTPVRLLFAAGGTGGHVYPALAIAEHIVARLGDSVNCEFAGTRDRMEWEAVQRAGFAVHPIPAVALRRPVASLQNLLLPFR